MFWRFGSYANISTLDTILDKPDVTVEELLEESDLIQELKQQNSKLIEYLRDDNVLQRLLEYVIAPQQASTPEEEVKDEAAGEETTGSPSLNALDSFFRKAKSRSRSKSVSKSDEGEESKEEKQRLKYAYVACEILSSEVWSISEALLENQDSLRKFWQYLKQPPPLDPVQAGYFTKVNESLLDRKTEEMLDFFKSLHGIVPDMLQHVDCPMIMDLLLKIISLERSEGGHGIVDWLQTQNLMPLLLAYLSQEHSPSTQTSAGDFIKAIITISANATTQDQNVIGPNELTRELVSETCIQQLIQDMLRGGNPLTVGVGIVIEVIRKNNSDYDLENQIGPTPKSSDPIYLGTLLRRFAKHVPDFMALVHNPDHTIVNSDGTTSTRKRELKAAFGAKIEPLGFDRFKTCELMAELLHCSNMALLNERGSEAEVKRRDAERERLKAEGKLLQARDEPTSNEFGTSVDSSGFHHARAPSVSSGSSDEMKEKDGGNPNEEEGFEKVTASEAQPDDIKDDFDEKTDVPFEPLERLPKVFEHERDPQQKESAETEQASPQKRVSSPTAVSNDPAAKFLATDSAQSPTSAGLTDKVGGLDLDQDTVMTSPPRLQSDDAQVLGQSEADNQKVTNALENLAKDVEKPAPLFSGKGRNESNPTEPSLDAEPMSEGGESVTSIEQSHDDEADSSRSILLGAQEEAFAPHYEVDIDGSPVVGDLLKMMFVEHHVVPTILDFFFRFPWNNFLHNVVYDVVQQVFNGSMDRGYNSRLAIDLFETGRITERIIEGQKASDEAQKKSNMRLGYMGHLTLISEEVVKFTERHPPEMLSPSVLEKVMSPGWIEYVEQTLAETRERDNAILGGVRPDMAMGPRQAVLNAVNAAQNFGGGSSGLAAAGLSGNGNVGLDILEPTNAGSASGGYVFSGGNLLSDFNHSSDEEDEEMKEEGGAATSGGGEQGDGNRNPAVSDSDQVGELSFEDIEMDYP